MFYCLEKRLMMRRKTLLLLLFVLSIISTKIHAQNSEEPTLNDATLSALIDYALEHQPAVKKATIDQEITDLQVKNKLADWYPQVNFNYNYQRNFQLPVNIVDGNSIRFGVDNSSALQFTATQKHLQS